MKKLIVTLAMLTIAANSFCMKKEKPSIEKAFGAQSLRENPIGAMMGELPKTLKDAYAKLRNLEVEYNKIWEKDQKTPKDLIRKSEIEKEATKLNAIIEKYEKKSASKHSDAYKKLKEKDKLYKQAMKDAKKIKF